MSKKNDSKKTLELYTDEQLKLIEEHIEKNFGEASSFFHEKESEYIQIKIYAVPPNKEQPYYTLVTVGMGAHLMNVPSALNKEKLKRAELVLYLPPNWNPNSEKSEHRWPLHLLSMLSRLPIEEDTWLGWGHTVDYGERFTEECGFSGIVLINSMDGTDSGICKFSDTDEVNFYQIILLHQNELDFKNQNGASALIGHFGKNIPSVYDADRKSVIPDNFMDILDTVEEHSRKVEEKELDILEINGANHIAAFLRWSIEHNLINDEMLEYFSEDFRQIRDGKYDIRKFLINSLGGELNTELFNDKGKAFCRYYYDFCRENDEPCYPGDVDRMALDYFGEEKYNCEEFQNEAYLFVPFDENYYKAISRYIDENYENFLHNSDTLDSFDSHAWKIKGKNLDIPEINAANHITAFLKWSIEHNLMCDDFMEFFSGYQKKIESGELDIRDFFINNLKGKLNIDMFCEKGRAFCRYYYDFCRESDEPCYPEDVDRMALDYFGEEKYNCDEFQNEAYLFVPFDENYYKAISRYIDENYKNFLNTDDWKENQKYIDTVDDHSWKIEEKNLDIPEINAANHITAFLKWSIEHNLMCDDFMEFFSGYQEKIESGELDIRDFFINNLKGELNIDMFSEEGQAFCRYYYDFYIDEPCYPKDVDRMALDYFGEEKYYCDEFVNEAYLFVPFNKTYYRNISRYINRNYRNFKKIYKK